MFARVAREGWDSWGNEVDPTRHADSMETAYVDSTRPGKHERIGN
jgi:hypothetical protein